MCPFVLRTAFVSALHDRVGGLRGIAFVILLVTAFIYTSIASAHEYWLSPVDYVVDVKKKILVDIRNGENFAGTSFSYRAENFTELVIAGNGKEQPITGRLGDYPAIHPTVDSEGLHSIVLSTTEKTIAYANMAKFEKFLDYHGLNEYAHKHQALGFPATDIKEHYFRFAKTYVHVTDEAGPTPALSTNDSNLLFSAHGLELEIVFASNPYSDDRKFELELLYRGEPLANRQVELFSKTNTVERLVTTTDSLGKAHFDNIEPGEHLLNAVHMVAAQKQGTQWKTLWASVTLSTLPQQ